VSKIKLTQEDFINKCISLYGNQYNYDLVEYCGVDKKVKIVCKNHSEFLTRPADFLKNHGCPKCRYVKSAKSKTRTTEQFIIESKEIHGNKYDYSKVDYIHGRKLITIICQVHGEFEQIANVHIQAKAGCPKCNSSKGEAEIRKWLLENKFNFKEQKTFIECINPITNRLLKFDFYIKEENTLIEYDGEQHFRANFPRNDKQKAIENLEDLQKRDQIKTQYCKDAEIKLIRIPYFKFPNIDKILFRELIWD
jgi:ssDNA-binding Zn-finger/Zn-ribbon topoisomerase 1